MCLCHADSLVIFPDKIFDWQQVDMDYIKVRNEMAWEICVWLICCHLIITVPSRLLVYDGWPRRKWIISDTLQIFVKCLLYYIWVLCSCCGMTVHCKLYMKWWYRVHQIPKRKWFCLILQLSLCSTLKPGVKSRMMKPTGDAPTASEWSTILLPAEVRLILDVWRYICVRYKGQKLKNVFQ